MTGCVWLCGEHRESITDREISSPPFPLAGPGCACGFLSRLGGRPLPFPEPWVGGGWEGRREENGGGRKKEGRGGLAMSG